MSILAALVVGTVTGLLISRTIARRRQNKNNHLTTQSARHSVKDSSGRGSSGHPIFDRIHSDSVVVMDNQHGVIFMDSLTHISGISESMARALNSAGILTYMELSNLPPGDITTLFGSGSPAVSIEEARKWVSDAEQLSRRTQ
ncbi:MAG: hypothetical protein GKR95_23845 [Gammaproteobacteria bacterium]|nr:hypothetical protein [Gammaproteobacteria bacterium]